MKKIFAALAILLSFSVFAQEESAWILVAGNHLQKNEFRKGTYELSRTRGGDEIAVVVGRLRMSDDNRIRMVKWYVKTSDCARGFGKLVTLNLDGEFQYDNDFVVAGGTIASMNAEAICFIYSADLKLRTGRGI